MIRVRIRFVWIPQTMVVPRHCLPSPPAFPDKHQCACTIHASEKVLSISSPSMTQANTWPSELRASVATSVQNSWPCAHLSSGTPKCVRTQVRGCPTPIVTQRILPRKNWGLSSPAWRRVLSKWLKKGTTAVFDIRIGQTFRYGPLEGHAKACSIWHKSQSP